MVGWRWALAVLVLAFSPLQAQPKDAASEVLRLHLQKFEWMVARDSAQLANVLLPDTRFVHSNGLVQSRTEILSDFRTRHLEYFEIAARDTTVRVYQDNTAIVNGRMRVRGAIDGKPYETDLLYTETWVRSRGRWRLAARHASRAP